MHRELESLRELNGNTSPGSSQRSIHSHVVRLSESPGSVISAVSTGSPTIAPSKLMKELGLGITGMDMVCFFTFYSRVFQLTFIFCHRPTAVRE